MDIKGKVIVKHNRPTLVLHQTEQCFIIITTSGQSNLTTGRIAAEHGQFTARR